MCGACRRSDCSLNRTVCTAAESDDLVLASEVAQLERWLAHLHAQRFDFIRPGENAPISIEKVYDRFAGQLWIEDPVAAAVEAVRVRQRDQARVHQLTSFFTNAVTTPQICCSWPSANWITLKSGLAGCSSVVRSGNAALSP